MEVEFKEDVAIGGRVAGGLAGYGAQGGIVDESGLSGDKEFTAAAAVIVDAGVQGKTAVTPQPPDQRAIDRAIRSSLMSNSRLSKPPTYFLAARKKLSQGITGETSLF